MSRRKTDKLQFKDPGLVDEYQSKSINAVNAQHANNQVRFSLRYVDLGKQYHISKVPKGYWADISKKLGRLESLTIHQFTSDKVNGLSFEPKSSSNFKFLKSDYEQVAFDYFGHFRVKNSLKFRIFIGYKNELYYLLLFDKDGRVNWGSHK